LTEPPVHFFRYLDNVAWENIKDPTKCRPAERKIVGWIESETIDSYLVGPDLSLKILPGEQDPRGHRAFTILKSTIVEVRRLTVS
jgi:hypothetical protein